MTPPVQPPAETRQKSTRYPAFGDLDQLPVHLDSRGNGAAVDLRPVHPLLPLESWPVRYPCGGWAGW